MGELGCALGLCPCRRSPRGTRAPGDTLGPFPPKDQPSVESRTRSGHVTAQQLCSARQSLLPCRVPYVGTVLEPKGIHFGFRCDDEHFFPRRLNGLGAARRTLRQVKWGEQFPMDSYAALCSQVLCCDNVQSRAVLLSREIFYSVVTTAGGHRRKQRWKGNYSILRGRCTPIVPLCLQLESLPVPPIVPTVTGH